LNIFYKQKEDAVQDIGETDKASLTGDTLSAATAAASATSAVSAASAAVSAVSAAEEKGKTHIFVHFLMCNFGIRF